MNDKFLLFQILILFFSFVFTFTGYTKASGNNLSGSSDSAKVQTEKNLHHLKYALRSGNPHNSTDFLSSDNNEIPAGHMLDDGTTWLYETDINNFRIASMAGV